MSKAEIGKAFIEHYGVKGQKWGVRRARRKEARADKKWQKNIYSTRGAIAVHNAAATRFNSTIGAVNARHLKADLIDNPNSAASKRYLKDVETLSSKSFKNAVQEVHGTSPSGRLKATIDTSNPDQYRIVVSPVDIEHATETLPEFVFELGLNAQGRIDHIRMIEETDEMEQSETFEQALAHHGVKGQRWGVRRSRRQLARAAKSRTGKSVKDMSNEELQTLVTRMNLEQQYSRLSGGNQRSVTARGAAFAGSIAANIARTQITNAANAQIAKALSK